MKRIITGLKLSDEIDVIYNKAESRMYLRDFLSFVSDNLDLSSIPTKLSDLIQGTQQGETLRWNDALEEWEVSDKLIIADNGNIGIGGVLNPNYQVHIDNGDVFLATGSIGINEAPTDVHFLRISTNDALPQTVNARIDLSYQNKTGTFQGLHIMSNTSKTGSNSLAYGVNVTLQGAATSGTHEYIAARFKAVGATKNYAIKVHEGEGLSLFGTATELYSNAVVQIKGGVYNGKYYKPLVIQGSASQFNWTWNYEGRVAVGRDTNMFEAINLQDQKIRVDNSSYNFTEYTANGIQVKTTYPQLSKNTQVGKTVYGMGRGSSSIMTEFVEGNAVYFNHYNTNRFSAIMGRDYMAIYTNGTWNVSLDRPNQDTAIRTAIFREGKVGIGSTFNPLSTLHIRETRGIEAFRIDTTLTNNFIKHFTNGVNDYLLIGGINSWTGDRVYIYNSSSNSYLGIQGVGESGIRLRSFDGTVTSWFTQVGNSILMTRSAANYEIRYSGDNHTILKINTQSGKFFFNGGNNYTSVPANEKDFDISANGLFRRKFLSSNYQNVGDKGDSYGLSFQSAEFITVGASNILRKSEFTFQNRIENNDINTTGFYLSNEYYDNTVQTSLADLLRVSHDGDLEILQSGANGKGLILTDKTLGTRHRIELDNLTVTVSAAL
jgi:hypothetical protein